MIRSRRIRREHSFEAINVTPLIDVVMVLIIFFLIVGRLADDPAQGLRLPGSKVGQLEPGKSVLVVTILREPSGAQWVAGAARVLVESQDMPGAEPLEALVRARLAEAPGTTVQVRADRDLPYGSIEPVLRALGRAGARSVRLATERLS
ncbi:MAG TPA: biopolymer transporter ExbD [Phycisphaerales bacterium]|nr:biopolymer transporter ExbD [Phycisphaerales bacterium]